MTCTCIKPKICFLTNCQIAPPKLLDFFILYNLQYCLIVVRRNLASQKIYGTEGSVFVLKLILLVQITWILVVVCCFIVLVLCLKASCHITPDFFQYSSIFEYYEKADFNIQLHFIMLFCIPNMHFSKGLILYVRKDVRNSAFCLEKH